MRQHPEKLRRNTKAISIHSSQAGWDLVSCASSTSAKDFNPLIPSGMRLVSAVGARQGDHISIHSSQAGWDQVGPCSNPSIPYFNPLIPSGMRLEKTIQPQYFFVFQSTHPKRDETSVAVLLRFFVAKFQSTHPKRDETQSLVHLVMECEISIHSSQAGWDT